MEQQAETFKEQLNRELASAGNRFEEQQRILIMEAQGEIF